MEKGLAFPPAIRYNKSRAQEGKDTQSFPLGNAGMDV